MSKAVGIWSASVRFAEVDGQNVVFNSHYLTYCDEAMSAFCASRGLPRMSDRVQVVSSTLNWRSAARWGETVHVDVECTRVGRTSFTLEFVVRVGGRLCCEVSTTYVHTGDDWRPAEVPEEARAKLLG